MNPTTDKTADSYNRTANQYEKTWEAYLRHTYQAFIKELHTDDHALILDASCGTGLLAKQLVVSDLPFERLVLNDIATDMQQKAKDRLGGHPNISFTRQPVQNLTFGNRSFTTILCLNAFHNYPGQRQVLQNFWDILQPGGVLYILDWNNSGLFRLVHWLIRLSVPERIDARSLREIHQLCVDTGFEIQKQHEWYYRYWKFFFIKAQKPL